MSDTLLATTPSTAKFGASAIDKDWPSRDLTSNVWPSSLSTVPRMRAGVVSGGFWAQAGKTSAVAKIAARNGVERITSPLPVALINEQRRNMTSDDTVPHLTFR